MKLTFKELLSRSEHLHDEVTSSVPDEVWGKLGEDKFYDVKLVINGIECEPRIYNKIIKNFDKYIETEAQNIVKDRFQDIESEADRLNEIIKNQISNLVDKLHYEDVE